jgi:DNA-binding NarL/FixJ family response regulator
MIRIAIADDHLLVINGLKAMISTDPQVQVAFSALSGRELLDLLKTNTPDVLLLDIQIPDISGIDLCREIKKKYPSIKIVALTSFDGLSYVKQMMRNGASGYLLKNVDVSTLLSAVRTVADGEQYIDAHLQETLLDSIVGGKKNSIMEIPLTKRETEILALIAQEYSNQQIADKLFISLRTVHSHRINLNQKLGVHNTAGLVIEAFKRGLV